MSIFEPFTSSIVALQNLVSLMEQLSRWKSRRSHARFDDQIRPIHEAFQEVHFDYSEAMWELYSDLPSRDDHGELWNSDGGGPISEAVASREVRSAKSRYEKRRLKYAHVRDWLRHNAHALLSDVEDLDERRYLLVIIHYFLESDHFPHPDAMALDACISLIIEEPVHGGNILSTPSSRLSAELKGRTDSVEVRKITLAAVGELNQRCADVVRQYVMLKNANLS